MKENSSFGDVPVGTMFIYEGEAYSPSLPQYEDTCIGCAFDGKRCLGKDLRCMADSRQDEQDVIFVKY